MNQKIEKKHTIDLLFVISLFGVFTLSALILVSIGASVYKSIINEMDSNFNSRTSIAYITEKFRAYDSDDTISVTSLDNTDTLVMTQILNNTIYHNYFYLYNGYLCELFIKDGRDVSLASGQKLIPLNDFQINALNSSLFEVLMETSDNEQNKIYIYSHSNND